MTPTPALSHTPSELKYYNSTESSSLQVSVSSVSSTVDTTDGMDWDAWNDQIRPFKQAALLIWKISNIVVSVFGIFGNFMIMLIMFRLPASTSSVFFQVLAWSDQLLLVIGPLSSIVFHQFRLLPFAFRGPWQCKITVLMLNINPPLSAWMLVTLAMLRAASVLWPLRIGAVWTKRKSRCTAGIVTVVIFVINCHVLYGYDMGSCHYMCCEDAVSETYSWFYGIIWQWVEIIQCCVLPLTLLGVSNSVLLWNLVKSVRTSTHLVEKATQDSRQQRVNSLTVTLIVTSITFFLLTTPAAIFKVTIAYVNRHDPTVSVLYDIFKMASDTLVDCNSAVNFYLYCLTSTKFRAQFKSITFEFFGFFYQKNVRSERRPTPSETTMPSSAGFTTNQRM